MLLDLLIRFSDPYVGTFGVDLSDEESERRLRSRRSLRSSRKREFSFELDLIVGREEDSCHGVKPTERRHELICLLDAAGFFT
ncbi:uncharacterized protein LOC135641638 isoform X3 [Musa acuminata AAA Group]|uniref:uncharacterized protein LOC135641638 isoform X3 n=1 Tax=Musa acuminata AAA Group TaxID=214697 RepID=UPI0031D5C8B5